LSSLLTSIVVKSTIPDTGGGGVGEVGGTATVTGGVVALVVVSPPQPVRARLMGKTIPKAVGIIFRIFQPSVYFKECKTPRRMSCNACLSLFL
jgi:hypothetical protein